MTDHAAMTTDGTLTIARDLPGPIERVWAYLVEPEKRAQWIAGGPMELKAGGAVRWRFSHSNFSETPAPEKYKDHDGKEMRGTVTRCEPPRLIAFTWFEGARETPSEVTITLEEAGDKVRLTLVHVRLVEGEARVNVSAGWHSHLDVLGDVLEGRQARDFWPRHAALEADYQARLAD